MSQVRRVTKTHQCDGVLRCFTPDLVVSVQCFPGVASLLPLLPLLKGQVVEISPATRVRLEELQLEGDLLEVSLDQTHIIHRVLQASSAPPTETLHTLIQVRSRNYITENEHRHMNTLVLYNRN